MQRLVWFFLLGCIAVVYLTITNRYSIAIPPPWPPEEIGLINLAQNLATGKELISLLHPDLEVQEKQQQQTIHPLITYIVVLSLWGRKFGFDLFTARWLSKLLGIIGLILLFFLARKWKLPSQSALLAVLWTSLDITYQLIGNLTRPETLCVVLMLMGLWLFTKGCEKQVVGWFILSSCLFITAMLSHPLLAVTMTLALCLTLCWQKQWRLTLGFCLPLLVSVIIAVIYVGGIEHIWGQLLSLVHYFLTDRAPKDWQDFFYILLGTGPIPSISDWIPSNTPLWLAILVTAMLSKKREQLSLQGWQLTVITVAYLTTAFGQHPWYFGWFVPFGYLLTAELGTQMVQRATSSLRRIILWAIVLIWTSYQVIKVAPCWYFAPNLNQEYVQFFDDLSHRLPPYSKILILSIPDPSFHLNCTRPDVILYIPPGTKTQLQSWRRFWQNIDGVVVIDWVGIFTKPIIILPSRYKVRHKWEISFIHRRYSVFWLEFLPDVSSE